MTTSVDYINLYTHVNFIEDFRDSIFNTNPDYFNTASSATITDYFIVFSTITPMIQVVEELIGIDEEPVFAFSSVVVGSSTELLAGTLPQKIHFSEYETDSLQSAIYDYSTTVQPIMELPREEVIQYFNSNNSVLLTRYDSSTDLTDLLLVNDGELNAMPNDVFFRELKHVVDPEFYDETNKSPQPSGWGAAIGDAPIELYENTASLQEICVTDFLLLKDSTTTELIDYFTQPPLISFSTKPEHIVTSNDQTATAYLNLNFKTNISVTDEMISDFTNPVFFIFRSNEFDELTKVVCIADIKYLKYGFGENRTSGSFELDYNIYWSDLIVI